MQRKNVVATIIAAAFALPLAATAGGPDKHTGAKKTAATTGAHDGGAQAMFTSMDKNSDGFISMAEATNTPHAADFAALDKNADGKLSAEEHANAKEHVAARAGANADAAVGTSPAVTTSEKKTY